MRLRAQIEAIVGFGLLGMALYLIVTAPSTSGTCGIELMKTATNTVCTGSSVWRFTAILTTAFLGCVALVIVVVEWIYGESPYRGKTWLYLDAEEAEEMSDSTTPNRRRVYTQNSVTRQEREESNGVEATEEESVERSSDSRT